MDLLRHRKRRDRDKRSLLFNLVIAGAKAISDAGLSLGVSFVVSAMNAEDLENVYDMAVNELGANSVMAIHFFPAGFGKTALPELAVDYRVWETLILDLTRRHHVFRKLNIAVSAP